MAEPQLEMRGVSKVYDMGEVKVHALRDVDLDVIRGEFLVVVGQSGSGKSTLLNMIGGMDRPTSGTIMVDGVDLAQANERKLTLYRRNNIGFVFQFFNLIPTLTALENVQVATEIVPDPMDPLESLRIVGLDERAGHFPSQLSGGQQQRVAVARALASNPQLLLCDEPTGNLDSETSRSVLALLQDVNLRLSKTVIMITHNPGAARLANRIAEIRDGRIVEVEENANLVKAAELEL
ncbi:MAG: ABC transporter ATP-binding protein [Vulcanimicrobiota bacterium]